MLIASVCLALAVAPSGFAIIVGNNASPSLHLPELRYADDDAARMSETFGVLGRVEVTLLTTFDADTARLHPELTGRAAPPTKKNVEAAFERLAAWGQNERSAGRRSRGYFVFSGHGDMEKGEGFLELADARLGSTELERLLKSAEVDELHIVLDSCNSWFVISPRRAGGQFFPTPAEATRALVERLPNVGVLVSTSAESEVYEWSELQSGVFSYALRSGLVGGADANHDGDLTYAELAAFIDTATKGIRNPNYRPRVFARGPGGGTSQGFASLNDEAATVLVTTKGQPVRLRVRDGEGIRLFDVNLSGGPERQLFLPRSVVVPGLIVEQSTPLGWQEFKLPAGRSVVRLTELEAAEAKSGVRGVSMALENLFEVAFDEEQVSTWTTREAAEENGRALGVSQVAVDRMSFFLEVAAERERTARTQQVVVSGGLALLGAGLLVGSAFLPSNPAPPFDALPLVSAVLLGEGAIVAIVSLLLPTPWAAQRTAFLAKLERGEANAAMATVDRFVRERLHAQQTQVTMARILGIATMVAGVGLGIASGFLLRGPLFLPAMTAGVLAFAAGATTTFLALYQRLPEADLLDVLQYERRQVAPVSLGFMPLRDGGALSLSGRF